MRVIIFAILICSLNGCGDIYRYAKSGKVGWALKKELRDKHSREIAIANFTKFQWDELFLFGPYESTRNVCKRLDLSQEDCTSTIKSTSTDDGEMLMIFRQKGNVVHSEMHFLLHGDFTPTSDEALTPESAVFTVSIDGKSVLGQDRLKLQQKPSVLALTGPSSSK